MKNFWSQIGMVSLPILFVVGLIAPLWDYPGFIWVIFQFIGMCVVARFFICYFIMEPIRKRRLEKERAFNEYYRRDRVRHHPL